MGKKPFIDRKTAKTFHLVHRSQRDPLLVTNSENASSRVFTEVHRGNSSRKGNEPVRTTTPEEGQDEFEDDDDDVDMARAAHAKNPHVGEAALYGVYFDDTEYDYTQHLKPTGQDRTAVLLEAPAETCKGKQHQRGLKFTNEEAEWKFKKKDAFQLPEEALPSQYELDVGLLNQEAVPEDLQGLQPDMDPELREALVALEDDAFIVPEEELVEEYLAAMNAEEQTEHDGEEYEKEGEDDVLEALGGWRELQRFRKIAMSTRREFDEEDDSSHWDAKSMGTLFSMSSSSMFRNDKLQLLDERFDKIEKLYDDTEEDDGEAEAADPENLDEILDEFLDKFDIIGRKMVMKPEGASAAENVDAVRKQLGEARLDEDDNEDSDSEEARRKRDVELMAIPSGPKRPDWDCQSVLSTYTNLENRPAMICEYSDMTYSFTGTRPLQTSMLLRARKKK